MHAITSKPGRDLDVSAQVPWAWAYSQDMVDIEAGIFFCGAISGHHVSFDRIFVFFAPFFRHKKPPTHVQKID